jgi:hypothetical protein
MALSEVCQKAKTIVILVVCLPWPSEHKSHPHMGIGRPPFEEPYGSAGVHTEDYYFDCIILLLLLLLLLEGCISLCGIPERKE